jgi:hypothetical protein
MPVMSKARSFIYFFLRCLREATTVVKAAFIWIVKYIANKANQMRQNNGSINQENPKVTPVDQDGEDESEESGRHGGELVYFEDVCWGADTPITIDAPVFHPERLPTVCEDTPCVFPPHELPPSMENSGNSGVSQTKHSSLLWDILNSSPKGLNSRSPVPWCCQRNEGDPRVGKCEVCEIMECAGLYPSGLSAAQKKAKVKLA